MIGDGFNGVSEPGFLIASLSALPEKGLQCMAIDRMLNAVTKPLKFDISYDIRLIGFQSTFRTPDFSPGLRTEESILHPTHQSHIGEGPSINDSMTATISSKTMDD